MIKNSYGYLKKHNTREIIKTLLLFALPIGVLLIGIQLTGSKRNLLTVVAVLGLLPAAKELVLMIMSFKAVRYSCSLTHYENVQNVIDGSDIVILYDLYFTAYDTSYPVWSMLCYNNSLIGYSDDKNFKHDKFSEHLKIMLSQNGLKVSNIKIFTDEKKYLERLTSLSESPQENIDKDNAVNRLMQNLTI